MCGRFTLTTDDVDDVARELDAEVDRDDALLYRPRWNVAPTDVHWVVHHEDGARRVVPARFGVTAAGGRFVINARGETAAALRTFKDAFQSSRCVVPADGFFEWHGGRGDRRPLWFHPRAGGLLLFAGLLFENQDGPAFVILTTAANELVRPVHDRMPALLSREAAERWLAHPDATLLAPAPADALVAREVSQRVNAVENDGPELLETAAPPRQLTLT